MHKTKMNPTATAYLHYLDLVPLCSTAVVSVASVDCEIDFGLLTIYRWYCCFDSSLNLPGYHRLHWMDVQVDMASEGMCDSW